MRVVDTDTYAFYTGDRDTDADAVEVALDAAIQFLEERLGRRLALDSHTERLRVVAEAVTGTHVVYPAHVPIVSTEAGTISGNGITGISTDGGVFVLGDWSTVTYLGGFTPDTLPASMRRDISLCARELIDAHAHESSPVPVGATSVRLGDAAVTYGPDGAPGGVAGSFGWSNDTLRWRRRSV